jgi:hypothetical protein
MDSKFSAGLYENGCSELIGENASIRAIKTVIIRSNSRRFMRAMAVSD